MEDLKEFFFMLVLGQVPDYKKFVFFCLVGRLRMSEVGQTMKDNMASGG